MKKPALFGKYLLLERLNVGGMAEVFAAKSFGVEGFERILAIKKILPTMAEDQEFITMFIDEARISSQLSHANIVQIHDFGIHDQTHFLAMEYVSGKDLRAVLERYRRRRELMPVAMAVFIATRICEGLDYAHRKKDVRSQPLGIIHRDVSPQNILLSYDGEVKIIDFGIAKAHNRQQRTQAGILKGKFGYMSPEQVRGLEIDRRSDIFALGVIMYEMLTGEKLFVGESDFSTLEKVRQADVAAPRQFNPEIPAGLERVVLKALARETSDRYQWASDLQEDLMRFLLAGDAIYSPKHLTAFMRDAFAEDLLKEGERMERFAAAERPPDLEPAGVSVSSRPSGLRRPTPAPVPQAPARAARPVPAVSPSSGEGALAVGLQRNAVISIPAPTPEELAELDGSRDQTVIVSEAYAVGAGNSLKTEVGSLSPVVTAAPARQVRPSQALGSPTAQTVDALDATSPRAVPAGPTLAARPGLEDSASDLRPLETTGFHAAVDARDRPGPPVEDDTLLAGRNRPKIVIGDLPVPGTTAQGRSPLGPDETRLFSDEDLHPAEPTDEHQLPDEEALASSGRRTTLDASPVGAHPGELPTGPQPVPAPLRAAPRVLARPRPRVLPPRPSARAQTRRRWLLVAIAVAATLALGVAVAVALSLRQAGARATIVPSAVPALRFKAVITPGSQTFTEATSQVELEPGEYQVVATPSEPGYAPASYGLVLGSGSRVDLKLEFRRDGTPGASEAPRRAGETAPGPAAPPAPPAGATPAPGVAPSGAAPAPASAPSAASPPADAAPALATAPSAAASPAPGAAGSPSPSPPPVGLASPASPAAPRPAAPRVGAAAGARAAAAAAAEARAAAAAADARPAASRAPAAEPARGAAAPSTWTAVIRSDEPGMEILVGNRKLGVTPGVVVKDLPFGKPLVGQARKEGFEVLNFQADNPERRATLVVQVLLHTPAAAPAAGARAAPAGRALGKLVCRTTASWGAEVLIDGKSTGRTTPIPLTQALELPLGKHRVVFRLGEKSTPPQEFVLLEEHREHPLLLTGDL